jgi:hypothetical protein
LLLVIVMAGGCGERAPTQAGASQETEHLTAIRKAYVAATARLGRPPKDLEELKPSLAAEGNVADLLVSPNDGLPFVIVFGADHRKHVIAYEQKGVDGVRLVVDQTQLPRRVTQEQFNMLSFPPGYKRPDVGK